MEIGKIVESMQQISARNFYALQPGMEVYSYEWNLRHLPPMALSRELQVLNLGTITKLTKKSVTVVVQDVEQPLIGGGGHICTGRIDRLGSLRFPSTKYGFSLCYRSLWIINPDLESAVKSEVERELRSNFHALSEKRADEQREKSRKLQEKREAAERARISKIDAFWDAEGRAIWESRQIHHLPLPFEMHVFTRPATIRTADDSRQYEVVPKVTNCMMTISDDKYDWKAKEEGRALRQIVEIQVSGFEMRNYDGVMKPSSFSSSSYSFELGSSYQKQFMYDLFGGW